MSHATAPRALRISAPLVLRSLTVPAALLVVALVFGLASPRFLTATNLLTILNQAAVVGVIGIGMTFVLMLAGIDLSVGSTATLATVVLSELLVNHPLPVGLAMALALLTGVGVGLVNGLLVVKALVPPIIVTLGTLSAVQAIAQYLSGSQTTSLDSFGVLTYLGQGYVGRVPVPGIILLVLAGAGQLALARTAACRRLRAIGANRDAAALMGLPVVRSTVAVYVLSGLLASFAGLIIAGQLSASTPNAGYGLELPAITAAVLGGTSLFGGSGSVIGTLVGSILLAAVFNGLILLGFSAFTQQVATGVILALTIALNEALRRRSEAAR
ncbi:MAG TPA: ABC transporter permease [Actinomycetes bacterium]|jgi:ribose transport system permease protein|nr:ABC transporter permease [Actinomycetes bacterium]